MILPSPKITEIIRNTITDPDFRDMLLRKFYVRELLNESEESLKACYSQLWTMPPGIEKEELSLHRLNLETHIEFLNREYFRVTNDVDARMPGISVEAKKKLNQLEIDFNNNKL